MFGPRLIRLSLAGDSGLDLRRLEEREYLQSRSSDSPFEKRLSVPAPPVFRPERRGALHQVGCDIPPAEGDPGVGPEILMTNVGRACMARESPHVSRP